MKLTKQAREELRTVLYHFERAKDYLERNDVAIAHKSRATTTLHFTCAGFPYALYEVDKEIGSDLTGLAEGIKQLAQFIVKH